MFMHEVENWIPSLLDAPPRVMWNVEVRSNISNNIKIIIEHPTDLRKVEKETCSPLLNPDFLPSLLKSID